MPLKDKDASVTMGSEIISRGECGYLEEKRGGGSGGGGGRGRKPERSPAVWTRDFRANPRNLSRKAG